MDFAVSVLNLKKKFPVRKGFVEALCGVDLNIVKGEIFGFLGPNGAGKTTTLRILTTLLPFNEGEVVVAGINIHKDPQTVRKRVGYVSQKGGADRHATGWENLMLQGHLYGLSKEDAAKQAKTLTQTFSLAE